ncbi:MAG: Guanyl-specific ribonuclease [Rhodanobacteraceae bacterium]|jgi:guanyl-specific ribonuclease Sa|nr:MAG: Guanyl-specific ribonuclease [Rhodanobacteraceae bacterium]
MQRSWKTLLPLLVLALVVGYLYMQRHPASTQPAATPPIAAPTARPGSSVAPSDRLPAFLPPEARDTLASIARGGPFPHRQDGVVFGNYEHLLPEKPRGYYHEYTVETPGAPDRGARRIIAAGNPPEVYYYTDDHYRSFREFEVPR